MTLSVQARYEHHRRRWVVLDSDIEFDAAEAVTLDDLERVILAELPGAEITSRVTLLTLRTIVH